MTTVRADEPCCDYNVVKSRCERVGEWGLVKN